MLTAPLVIVLFMALVALALHVAGRSRVTRILLICAAILAYLSSISFVGQALLHPLEAAFPPLGDVPPTVGYVVVLGSGYAPHDGIPVTAALDEDGLVRAVEAVRLARALRGSLLVVSGGGSRGHLPAAQGYAQLARALGVPEESIIMRASPLDTKAEAREVGKLLGNSPFLLVTSAYHMPRAMLMMRRAGANPIAAPTGQRAFGAAGVTLRAFLPGSGGLRDTERAIHEYLGLAAIAGGLD
jgi:uncharacterized SAM-binding protein YcdF (DUF218 family)